MILSPFYKNYIPKSIKEGPQYGAAKNLVGACLLALIVSPIFSLLYYALHHSTAAYLILFQMFFSYAAIVLLKRSHSVTLASSVVIGSLICLLTWLTYSLGGIYSSAGAWLIIPPIAATFISGFNIGLIWCAISLVCTSILFALEFFGVKLPVSPITHPLLLHYISLCGLTVTTLILAYFYEIEKRRTLRKLHYLAYHDPLTNLPNRIYFKKILESVLHLSRTQNTSFALLFLDFDNFKTINDTLGHNVGDQLLREAARRIKQCLQPSDVASRIGGDEFNILLTSPTNDNDIALRATAILTALKSPYTLNKHEANVTASIGIALAPANSVNYFLLNRYADLALYRAKEKGGDNFQFFSKKLAQKEFMRVEIERKLPFAIPNNEFYLHFQPIFDAQIPTQIVSIESLIRWKNPELGNVPPSQFIPIAERTGLIASISHWVLRESCQQYMTWLKLGLVDSTTPLQVNISAQQLNKESHVVNIKKIITGSGVPFANLILELTETEMLADLKNSTPLLQKIKDLGISIAIDDFGTGYTSLTYLNSLPIDIIKIDKFFIKNLYQRNNLRIVAGLIQLGHSLNLKIIAEGVITTNQLFFLQQHRCDYVQGFLLSKPVSAKKMRALLVVNKTQNAITQPRTHD